MKIRVLWLLCFLFPLISDVHAMVPLCPDSGNEEILSSCISRADASSQIYIQPHKSILLNFHLTAGYQDEKISRVSIADPELADVEVITLHQILIVAKDKTGTTNLIVWLKENDGNEEQVRVYDINVTKGLVRILQQRIPLYLKSGENVQALPGVNGVILTGKVTSQTTLDRLMMLGRSFFGPTGVTNLMTVQGSQQVQLEVKIAEVSRSGAKQMGLGFLGMDGDLSIGVFPSGEASGSLTDIITPQNISGTETNEIISQFVSEMTLNSAFPSAFQVALTSISDDAMAVLSLLKSQGLTRILASPTLVSMTGQEASFLVGGQFPVPYESDGDTSIEYKDFGVGLTFTPTVIGDETINLKVQPEISSIDASLGVSSGGVSVPGIKTRRGSTTLMLKDGQTFVMAGLLSEETQSAVSKLPFLGDLPVLGTLFTSKEFQRNETELMILVTPRLVKALNSDEIPPLPGERMTGEIGDTDFFLLNKTEKTTSLKTHDPEETAKEPGLKPSGTAQEPDQTAVEKERHSESAAAPQTEKSPFSGDTSSFGEISSPVDGIPSETVVPGFVGDTGFTK